MSKRRRRAQNAGRRQVRAAIAATALIMLVTYAAFAGKSPFGDEFELRANFSSANQLKPGNPVRLAGVSIGEVTDVGPGRGETSTVTMRIDDPSALHANAALSIEPRLLFEGNFYVQVRPGTPAAPRLRDGATIPISRTDAPVQLDQALSVFTSPVRQAMTDSVSEFADGLGGPSPQGYEGLRRAARELDGALNSARQTADALQGTRPDDLRDVIASGGDLTAQMARDPAALAGLVTNFNRVAAALSADTGALSASVRKLDDLLRVAPPSLTLLDSALPVLTVFADRLRPSLQAAPVSLRETAALLRQVRAVVRPGELPALVDALEPVTAELPGLERRLRKAFSLVTPAARCVARNVLPVLNSEVPDGRLSTGRPAWQDLLHMGANLTQTSPGFDGNGGTLRIGLAESENTLAGELPGIGEVIGFGEIQGVNPVWLGAGVEPEYRPDQWCTEQPLPQLDSRDRPGLPTGLQSAPAPKLSSEERERKATLLEGLYGSSADRRSLRRMLARELPDRGEGEQSDSKEGGR